MEDGYMLPKMKMKYCKEFLYSKIYADMAFSAICAIISVFMIKWDVLYYALAFVICEVIRFVLEMFCSFCWNTFYWNKLTTKQKYLKTHNDYVDLHNWSPETFLMYDYLNDAKKVLSELSEYYDYKSEEEKIQPEEPTGNLEINAFVDENKKFKRIVHILKTEENKIFFVELFKNIDKIIELLLERPANTVFANKLFNIYMPELIALLNNVPKEESQRKQYLENVMEVLIEIDGLVKETIKTIHNFNKRDSEITFDVLVKDIRQSKEELNGRFDN